MLESRTAESGLDTQHASFLAEASKQLASSLDYEATLKAVARLAVPALADWSAVDILDEDGVITRFVVAHVDPPGEALGWELKQRYLPSPTARSGVVEVLRTGRSLLLAELTDQLLVESTGDTEDLKLFRTLGLGSAILVPLIARDRTLGVLTLARSQSQGRYSQADMTLADELASRSAWAVDNARLYRQAREALELRDTFLATVSHDLRNPLSFIAAQAQLLRRAANREGGPTAERISEGLLKIDSTVKRMTAMIDELLDLARLEVGHPLELQRCPTDLVGLARRKVAEYQQTTEHHLIRVAAETELIGDWDPARLERVADNLLSNAIKYSPDGGVITVVVVRDEDETGVYAILSVRDPGVGIPPDDLQRIFQRFHRAGNVGPIRGTGIGLAVSRQIVEQHGGTISVDSIQGQGSVFTVRLPVG